MMPPTEVIIKIITKIIRDGVSRKAKAGSTRILMLAKGVIITQMLHTRRAASTADQEISAAEAAAIEVVAV